MQFTSEKANFFQCGFNFYIGDIDDESTILFKEDYVVIGNINTFKNIFAMGELIVIGNINSKSIYASKDFFCLGKIDAESVEVEGKSKLMSKDELENKSSLQIVNEILENNNDYIKVNQNEIIQNQKTEDTKENYCKQEIDSIYNIKEEDSTILSADSTIIDIDEVEELINNSNEIENLNELYQKYINKKGDIVFGKVLRIEEDKYIIQLDDIECQLFKYKECKFNLGDTIGAYIQTIKYEKTNLEICLVENDRSYITKLIKLEMEKNKYDFSKVFIKEINIHNKNKYTVYIYSEQHTQETLIIESKLNKYSNGKEIKLCIYNDINNLKEDISSEINQKLEQVLNEKSDTINELNSIHNLYVGDIINHNKFGKGKIISIIDTNIANIEFNGCNKSLDLNYLINNNLISKDNSYDYVNIIDNKNESVNINNKLNKEYVSKSKVQILEKYEKKKYTLIEGTVLSIDENYIKFNINNEAIGILRKENDCIKNKIYKVGEVVICYISSVYIKQDRVEIQIYRNTSNFFKLLFNKYKKELNFKQYNLKLCKFTEKLGVRLVVERRYGLDDNLMLNYINDLMNKDIGADLVKIIVLQYSPYTFLSKLFNISESSIELKYGKYYLNDISKENIDSVNDIVNEVNKIVSYKVCVNDYINITKL